MLISKAKDESTEKSNPMAESEICYRQAFGKALVGLAKALKLRDGRLADVKVEDILDYSDIDPEEFQFLFGTPMRLLADVRKEIKGLFGEAEKLLIDMDAHLKLYSIFKRLKKSSPMLTVIRLTNSYSIWSDSLKALVEELAQGWPPKETAAWQYLYENFCHQFAIILEKWETADFSDDHINDCIRLINTWLEADEVIGETAADILVEWV